MTTIMETYYVITQATTVLKRSTNKNSLPNPATPSYIHANYIQIISCTQVE
jgi:hypothetical protein